MKKSILLTGGTGRIGTTLVKELVDDGYHLYITTRNIENGNRWLIDNNIDIAKITLIRCDFYESNSIDLIVNKITNNLVAVIHNARDINTLNLDDNGNIQKEQFQNELYIAVVFPYLLITKLLDNGIIIYDIIFISSMYGVVAPTPSLYENFKFQSPLNYGTGKAAQIHLTKEMAVRYAELNMRVNCISFGGVEGRVSNEFKIKYSRLCPLKRMLNQNDLYPVIQMLLNNKNLLITGENIKIDGGWTIW